LKAECSLLNPDIICVTESWLDERVTENELCIPGFNLLRLDRNRHGGGVAMYIKDVFLYKIISSCHLLECLIVSISFGLCKLCIGLFYRPPNSSAITLDNLYSTLCNLEICLFSHFILIGDFNVDFTVSSNHYLSSKLHSIASSFVLSQVVTQPTHFSHDGTPSLIDLVFVPSPSSVTSCEIVAPLSNSDHQVFVTYIDLY